jgi:hypothetical protein
MMEIYIIILNFKNEFHFWKKLIIRFVKVETDPRLWYFKSVALKVSLSVKPKKKSV